MAGKEDGGDNSDMRFSDIGNNNKGNEEEISRLKAPNWRCSVKLGDSMHILPKYLVNDGSTTIELNCQPCYLLQLRDVLSEPQEDEALPAVPPAQLPASLLATSSTVISTMKNLSPLVY